ncbi:hypothetical protein [Elioraea tepidiphila]|jgi:hypothetical protein|uniref:hypothetical protein n=1 Tax=Elioraea tepidiphila TaxID=457934 RepID=UPI002FD8AB94
MAHRGWLVAAVVALLANAAEAIGAAEPSLPLVAFVHALGAASSPAEGYTVASRAAQRIQGPANLPARGFVTALRDLPTAEIEAAIAARRAAMREEMSAELVAGIGRTPADETGFAALDQMTDRRVLALLTPEQQGAVTAAATARRAALVTRLKRAESRSLRGRVYEGDGVSFEFVDRTRVFVKSVLGHTLAGSYTEERDGRVVVTLNAESVVLAREGKRLVGGPTLLTRTK